MSWQKMWQNYLDVLKKYTVFTGRARRQEFWLFALVSFVISFVLSFIGPLGYLYSLAVLLPCLALGARRLHDTGRSGWWQLIGIIPLVGIIVLIVFAVQDSQPGENQFGPNPKSC